MRLALFTLIFCSCGSALAQAILTGNVRDASTDLPVEFVTVAIQGKQIGTSTNKDGRYQIVSTELGELDSVRFSMIGYETIVVPASTLTHGGNVQLKPRIYSLDEVVVRSSQLKAEDIMKRVIARRRENYDSRPFKLAAYYRDLRKVNGKYDHLIEVALNTYGKGIDNYHRSVELIETRKIDLVRFAHEENLVNQILRLDYIANSEGFINLSNSRKNDYKIEDIRIENGENIFVITSGVLPARKYTFFVRESDYSIVQLEMEDRYHERGELYTGPIDAARLFRLKRFKVVNRYELLDGKYYPEYLSALWEYDKYNTVTESVYEVGVWERELRINHVDINTGARPDPSRLMTKFGAAIDDQMSDYNPDFWKSFGTVPLTAEVVTDLERGGRLEDQFARNGKSAIKRKSFKCDKKLAPKERVQCLLENYEEQYGIPGAQFAMSRNGVNELSRAFGYADLDAKRKTSTATPFRIASVSKTFAAAAALKLVEDGKLSLSSPVQDYVPGFPKKPWGVSSAQLLGNTSGIRHYIGPEDFYRNEQYASATDALVTFNRDSLLFEPGTRFYYSSYGFNLLGAVIEGASGNRYLDYLKTAVLDPAGMIATYGANSGYKSEYESEYYSLADNSRIKGADENLSFKWPSGGMVSTADDLLRFGNALMNGKIVTNASFQTLLESQATVSGERTGYSFGWFVDTDDEGKLMIHHSGSAPSYSSHLLIYPAERIVIAYLANTGTNTYFDKDLADEIVEILEEN